MPVTRANIGKFHLQHYLLYKLQKLKKKKDEGSEWKWTFKGCNLNSCPDVEYNKPTGRGMAVLSSDALNCTQQAMFLA